MQCLGASTLRYVSSGPDIVWEYTLQFTAFHAWGHMRMWEHVDLFVGFL